MSVAAFTGLTKARRRLAELAAGLEAAAGGEVVERAAVQVQEQVDAVTKQKLGAHEATGLALSTATVTREGGLVLLTAQRYLHFHAWWPFRRGMPPFVLKRAAVIFARELLAAIGGRGAGGVGDAATIAEEVLAEDAAATEASAAKKRDTAQRRKDRAHDKRVKAREDAEERGRR